MCEGENNVLTALIVFNNSTLMENLMRRKEMFFAAVIGGWSERFW